MNWLIGKNKWATPLYTNVMHCEVCKIIIKPFCMKIWFVYKKKPAQGKYAVGSDEYCLRAHQRHLPGPVRSAISPLLFPLSSCITHTHTQLVQKPAFILTGCYVMLRYKDYLTFTQYHIIFKGFNTWEWQMNRSGAMFFIHIFERFYFIFLEIRGPGLFIKHSEL